MTHTYRGTMRQRMTKAQRQYRNKKRMTRMLEPKYKKLPSFDLRELLQYCWQWVDWSKVLRPWIPVKAS